MSASVEYLTWLGEHDLAGGAPPSEAQRAAGRARRLEQLAHLIERTQTGIAQADDRVWARRQETKLAHLETERDRLEQEDWTYQDALHATGDRCALCGRPIPRSSTDYGLGTCGPCNPTRRAQ